MTTIQSIVRSRRALTGASIGLLAVCAVSLGAAKPQKGIGGLSWMAGSWAGPHDGGVIEEHWMLPSGGAMMGMSRLVVNDRALFFEFLRIEERADGAVVYVAQPRGRCPAVEFTLTAVEVGSATFENPAHDNPRRIRYTLSNDGATLTARTEGVEKGAAAVHETVMHRAALAP
ncbi:MAG: DUF6265 family protein [Planctomycetota bacterium]|nr:DUF6265 family protein [Planctomycetota bacterium]